MNVRKIIDRSMMRNARKGRLKFVTEIYLRCPMKAIWESARFVACRCHLMRVNLGSTRAAAK
jgi:hypothetical protein